MTYRLWRTGGVSSLSPRSVMLRTRCNNRGYRARVRRPARLYRLRLRWRTIFTPAVALLVRSSGIMTYF